MSADTPAKSRKSFVLEILAVSLIALTAVLTAWSAFESSKWSGVMTIHFNEAGAARTESVRNSNLANLEQAVDVGLFSNYVDAYAQNQTELADFYLQRFPERLGVATKAWLATEPLQHADAPPSPFAMPQYKIAASAKSDQLEAKADMKSLNARQANQKSDNYTITSVFFATVILLAALATKMDRESIEIALLVGAVVIFIGTLALIATYPVQV